MTVVQILLVNVLTDGLPAVALARDPASPDTMSRRPERTTRLFPAVDRCVLATVGALHRAGCHSDDRRRGAQGSRTPQHGFWGEPMKFL